LACPDTCGSCILFENIATDPPIERVGADTVVPTAPPTVAPMLMPTGFPTSTGSPTTSPYPTLSPTDTSMPSGSPTIAASDSPSASLAPTASGMPSELPTASFSPTDTILPSASPTETSQPSTTYSPTTSPAPTDTQGPTASPDPEMEPCTEKNSNTFVITGTGVQANCTWLKGLVQGSNVTAMNAFMFEQGCASGGRQACPVTCGSLGIMCEVEVPTASPSEAPTMSSAPSAREVDCDDKDENGYFSTIEYGFINCEDVSNLADYLTGICVDDTNIGKIHCPQTCQTAVGCGAAAAASAETRIDVDVDAVSPVSAPCQDHPTAQVYIDRDMLYKRCTWLSANIAYQYSACNGDAATVCPMTCGEC